MAPFATHHPIVPWVKSLKPKVLRAFETVFPHSCHLCNGYSDELLCKPCKDSLTKNNGFRCSCCDIPLKTAASLCADCQKKTPSFNQVKSAWVYSRPVDQLIKNLKDHQQHYWANYLIGELATRIRSEQPSLPDVLVAVPTHWRKRLKRGFNQSQIITRLLSAETGIPFRRFLKKTTYTPEQKQLSRRQRIFNLKKSFQITSDVTGLHIALIDDVVTTGATIETISRVLIKAGAAKVDVWALARTPLER